MIASSGASTFQEERKSMLTRNPLGSLLGLSALLMSVWPLAAQAADIHVPADQPTIQAGINAAGNGDVVLVANGTYTGSGNKNLNFNGKAITVRSESNDPTLCIIDCQRSEGGFSFTRGETAASILSGFTIQNGKPTTTGLITSGNGMRCLSSSPTVTNCILAGNSEYEGGCILLQDSSATVTNCVFIGNSAESLGAGMFISIPSPTIVSSPTIINCTFTQNQISRTTSTGDLTLGGGGMYNDNCSPTLINCVFTGNSVAGQNAAGTANGNHSNPTVTNCIFSGNAGSEAGGMSNVDYCSPTLTNCIFTGNTGGGMMNFNTSNPTLTNCAFSGNSKGSAGSGIFNELSSNPILTNCILWGDANSEVHNNIPTSRAVITYSDVQGGYSETGNRNADPLFVRAPFTNGPADFGDLHLQPGSPATNAGNNAVVTVPLSSQMAAAIRLTSMAILASITVPWIWESMSFRSRTCPCRQRRPQPDGHGPP
jgi:parallel beta-helix repeat protein